jgi:hypothetical protein
MPQGDAYELKSGPVSGLLVAYEAAAPSTILREIWNSDDKTTDKVGQYAKFVPPTIADGKVFLATFSKQVDVYGLK